MLTPRQKAALWRWGFLALGLVALLLGFFGFIAQSGWSWDRPHVHDALFKTVQLFALAVSVEHLENPATQLASVLAPAATAGTLWLAFFGRILRRWQFFRLGWRPADDLFLGCGETAAAIAGRRNAGQAQGNAPRIVGLDVVTDTPLQRALREAGTRAPVFRGDARSRDYLDAVNAGAARRVWVLTGDDLRNIAIARQVVEMRAGRSDRDETVVVVGMREPALARAQRDLWRPRPGVARVEYFDLPRLAARRLLQAHPPGYPTLDTAATAPPLHLCVVGDSDYASALLVQAAMHCVCDDDPARCVQLTWVAPEAGARLASLHCRHPALDPANAGAIGQPGDPVLAGLLPLARFATLDADPAQLTPKQWLALQAQAAFSKIYVTASNDVLTRGAALRVQAVQDVCASLGRPGVPVVACLHDRASATGLDNDGLAPTVARFDALSECLAGGDAYPGERADVLAKIVHLAYDVGDVDAATAQDRARADARWAAETDEFRWSSRAAADHVGVKLALLGVSSGTARLDDADPGTQPLLSAMFADEATMQRLMRIEHRRFVAERLLEGWLPLPATAQRAADNPSGLAYDGEGLTQKTLLRLNRTLVAFDALTDAQKQFDRRIIEAIPGCLREARRRSTGHGS